MINNSSYNTEIRNISWRGIFKNYEPLKICFNYIESAHKLTIISFVLSLEVSHLFYIKSDIKNIFNALINYVKYLIIVDLKESSFN